MSVSSTLPRSPDEVHSDAARDISPELVLANLHKLMETLIELHGVIPTWDGLKGLESPEAWAEFIDAKKKDEARVERLDQLRKLFSELTEDEMDGLRMTCQGVPVKTIAVRQGVGERTVERRRSSLREKLGGVTITETIGMYREYHVLLKE